MRSSKQSVILVSGASGIVGYGILRSLCKAGGVRLIGSTIYPESPANVFADIFEQAPATTAPEYMDWLEGVIRRHGVDMVIPGIEIDMEVWNANRERLSKTGVAAMLNNPELIGLCLDKWKFHERLCQRCPEVAIRTSLSAAGFSFPLLLKPRKGFGSKGIEIVRNGEELSKFAPSIGEKLMVQELVGDVEHEYTISGFFDRDSNLKALFQLRRKLSRQGFTEFAETVDIPEMRGIVARLADCFKPVGPTNFQFRKDASGWKLLEINPRISSATSIKTAFGYNECAMAVDYFLRGIEVKQPILRKGRAMRYTEDFVEYDSTDI